MGMLVLGVVLFLGVHSMRIFADDWRGSLIARRGEASPESHLEAGLIYKQHIKDPIAAIYHFRKYLEQQPNSRQAPLVRQQIEAAKRDFGRTLPNQPLDSREVRLDGFDQRERLERENEQLRNELATLRGLSGSAPTTLGSLPRGATAESVDARLPAPAAADEASAITLAPIANREPEPSTDFQTPANAAGSRGKALAPSAAGGRRHTVAAKDSLYAIAKKYYGAATNARVQSLIEANRDVLPAGASTPLKEGMTLKIP